MAKWLAAIAAVLVIGFTLTAGTRVEAQQGAALTVPFTTTGTGQAGAVQITGEFRIAQFVEQNGRAFAVGSLAVGVGDPAAPQTFVSQAVVPVLTVRSSSSTAALSLGNAVPTTAGAAAGVNTTAGGFGATTTGSATGSVPAGTTDVFAQPITANGTTAAGTVNTGTAGTSTAGVPASTVPGQQANCGPLHLELGPVDLTQSGLAFHLDRLVLDLGAPQASVTSLNTAVCSADAALQAAATSGTTAQSTVGTTGSVFSGTTGAVGTTGTAGTIGTTGVTGTTGMGTAAGTAGTSASGTVMTPLQNFVAVLNQVIAAF